MLPVSTGETPHSVVSASTEVEVLPRKDTVSKFEMECRRIAPQSPLARALMGAVVGDVVIWRRPSGALELEVLEIGPIDPHA